MDELTSGTEALEPTEQSQSDPASATPQPKVDVVSREDFQRFQSLKDREIAQTRGELQQAQQAMAQMRQEVDNIRMSGLDDYGKLQYQMQRQQQVIEQLAREKAQAEGAYQAAMAQERLTSRIEKKTGLDRKDFFDAALSPDELWEKAWDIRSERGGKGQQAQQPTRRPAGQVDLGSGTPAPVSSDPEQRRKHATTKSFSADEYLDTLWDDQ